MAAGPAMHGSQLLSLGAKVEGGACVRQGSSQGLLGGMSFSCSSTRRFCVRQTDCVESQNPHRSCHHVTGHGALIFFKCEAAT